MNTENEKVITRFAPSPTGFMHIGGIRTALFAYLWARKNKGLFILRIEDTDKEREVEGSIEHIEDSLKWLGLDWDYGPKKPGPFGSCIQSQRMETYQEYARKLIEKGYAYPDPYTKEELEKFREEAKEKKQPFLFCNHRPDVFEDWDGKKPLRFKVPEIKRYIWQDAVRGKLEGGEEMLDDFILIKSDGYPTYNFAHIIDDYYMEITHIFRADEFISSTPRFLSLYDALGFKHPIFVTLPPILREDRTKKLGKRDGAKDILEYKKEGYLPESMINFLALIGWNPGTEQEVFSKDELITVFSLENIQKAGAILNEDKLNWMNREHMKLLPENIRNQEIKERLNINKCEKISEKAYQIIFDRISKWSDIDILIGEGELDYYINLPTYQKEHLIWKESDEEETKRHLKWAKSILEDSIEEKFNSIEEIKSVLFDYATKNGRGQVLWPIRMALSGKEKSPDPFTLIYILGKEESINRLQKAIEKLSL